MLGTLDALLVVIIIVAVGYLFIFYPHTLNAEGVQARFLDLIPSKTPGPLTTYPIEKDDGRRSHQMYFKAGSPWPGMDYSPDEMDDWVPPQEEWDLRDTDYDNHMTYTKQQRGGENRDKHNIDGQIETNTADYWKPMFEGELQQNEFSPWWGHMDV